jgi:hypothetical protein
MPIRSRFGSHQNVMGLYSEIKRRIKPIYGGSPSPALHIQNWWNRHEALDRAPLPVFRGMATNYLIPELHQPGATDRKVVFLEEE